MSEAALHAEVVDLARALIRVDTSNPPGNETPAAELLAEYLRGAGVECELAGPDPARLNLVARVRGSGDGPSLMLLAHTDVVPAPTAGWTVDPFGGTIRDGRLIGRGAADMKGELAARAAALAAYARSGERPGGDLVLVAESDEERNTADVGLSWLVRERPELRCDYAINEGAGTLLRLADGRRVVTIAVGEKKVSSLRVRVHGTAGHASVPAAADNPLRHAAVAVERLLAAKAPLVMTPVIARALEALGAPADLEEEAAVASVAGLHPVLDDMLPPMTRLTVTPTGLQTHEPSNVIPPYADIVCDCRALPGQGEDDVREHVRAALGSDFDWELDFLEPLAGGTSSEIDTRLYRACADYVAARVPGAGLLPLITPGFTDSHWIREEFSTVAYGFAPVFATDLDAYLDGVHGADEQIELADLVEMAEFHLHALRALAQG
jgi:acetylornithine deacetylase/succinyl-diaminopimelate desuccinylase-like protein